MPVVCVYLPGTQLAHPVDAWESRDVLPASHTEQNVLPAELAYDPPGHWVQVLRPESAANEPGLHATHTVAPVVFLYVPAAQGVQYSCPALAAYVPTWHGLHAGVPVTLVDVPGAHCTHAVFFCS